MRRLSVFLIGALITAMTATAAPAADYQTMSPGLQYRYEVGSQT